uniref:Coiled-coil domain containing 142 n=1 Tax=Acanthochromis polyacanthus TaxID=80966 RepID=A0A3Q1G0F8_9TELE
MDHSNPEIPKSPGGEPDLAADWENSESFCPEKEQKRCSSWTETEDVSINGYLSQSSISRSLQRAEVLLKNTFNPGLKWLFHGHSEDEEEENFVVAYNLVSRSSARLLRLQQALLTMSPQWQLVGGAQMASPQACVKGLPGEGGVLFLPSSCCLQGQYRALWTLLNQRSSLVFIHEYSRRARLAAAYIARVRHLLEHQLKNSHLTPNQSPSNCSPVRVGLGLLSQELRVHLNHWSCLCSKVQSDHYLRHTLLQQTNLLLEIKQNLDLLGLQALILMEHYVYSILSTVAQPELDSVPREVLEDILVGAHLYNQAVEEQRVQYSAHQLRTTLLQKAHYSTLDTGLPQIKRYHPSAFSVKEIMFILAVHHAEVTAKQLQYWAFEQSDHICQVHTNHKVCTCSDNCISQMPSLSCGMSALKSEWTWEQLQHAYQISSPHFCINHSTLQLSFCHSCNRTSPVYVPDLHLDSTFLENCHPVLAEPISVQHRKEGPKKDQTGHNQTYISQSDLTQSNVEDLDSVQSIRERKTQFENCMLLQTTSPTSTTFHHLTALPLSRVQLDHSSVQLLFQVFSSSSNDLLTQVASQTPTSEGPTDQLLPTTIPDMLNGKADSRILCDAVRNTTDPVNQNKDQNVEEPQQKWGDQEITTRPNATESSGFQRNGDSEKEDFTGAEGTTVNSECVQWPHSVQWSDLGQSLVFADLLEQYHTLLWTLCSKALWLQLHVSHESSTAESINLLDNHMSLQIFHRIGQALASVLCRSLGSSMKDQCFPSQRTNFVVPTSKQDGSVMNSLTMEHFLLLPPPLLSSLCCHHVNSGALGPLSLFPSRFSLQRQTVSLVLASVQLSTVWVMSKAYQFLSSWSLNKFLLITQGDLNMVRESLEMMVQQTKCLVMNSGSHHRSTFCNHNELLLGQQTEALDTAVSQLQTFSSLVLKTFSSDCKRMSGEIFERTMPSAVHWRPSTRADFPSSPSEYASLAAQTVIGQVLEGVAPLSDDARVQALSITMTAFMEAWMEHILKQKIKFSIHGALQLKQDFDSIRDMIQSDRYGLSSELHQRLLSLRVFQQVDSAVVCLLQQPQAKLYLQPSAWEPFKRCCPANSSRESIDASVSSSITNLRCKESEDATHSEPSVVTTHLPAVDPSSPTEPYLAPSLALGAAQQEWLDLRIQSSARRWRLPGLQCVSKSEP